MIGAWLWVAGCGGTDCASGFAQAADGNCYPVAGDGTDVVEDTDGGPGEEPTIDADTDGDGLSDVDEGTLGTDPLVADTDVDGLSDGEEIGLGTDPLVADTDADGLDDGDEAVHGADPLVTDTDGDGYADGDEVREGADPADDADRIYQGGWPYYADKDAIPLPPQRPARPGDRFARLELVDQYGDLVDLYDFYNADKPVVIEISAVWCGPCEDLSVWLSGDDSSLFDNLWSDGPDAIARGDVYWLTLLTQDLYGGPAAGADAAAWHAEFPNPVVPVLADDTGSVEPYLGTYFWPSAWLLDPDLTIVDTEHDVYSVTEELAARLP